MDRHLEGIMQNDRGPRARRRLAPALIALLLAGPAVGQTDGGDAPWSVPPAEGPVRPPPAAPAGPARSGVELGLVSGGAAFSAFRSQLVTARLLDGQTDGERSFERLIAPESSTAAALLATWWPSARWGVRVGAAYAASAFTIRLEERDRLFLERAGGTGETARYADLAIWLAEASLLVSLPSPVRRVEPYLVVGGGVVVYDPDESYGEPLPVGVREVMVEQSRAVQPAFVVGTGARFPLERGLALTFELVDHVTLSPFDQLEPATLERDGLRLELDGEDEAPGTRMVNHLRFAAGVSISLWR